MVDRFRAGESVPSVAIDFGIAEQTVEDAIRFALMPPRQQQAVLRKFFERART
jgi:hypothetical protein